MAGIADKIIDQGFAVSSGKVEQDARQSVVGMVNTMASIAQNRQELELAKQKMEEAKLTKFVDALDKGKTFKGAARNNYYKKFMPRMRDSLGLTEYFPDESLEFMTADEENLNRVSRIVAAVQEGKLTASQALAAANDPVTFAKFSGLPVSSVGGPISLTEDEIKQINEAGKFAVSEEGKTKRTHIAGGYAAGRQVYDTSVKAQEAASAKIGADYSKFTTAGGMANAEEKLRKLEAAAKKLEKGEVKTGTTGLNIATAIPFIEAKKILSRTHPELKAIMDDVEGAVNLKQALDSSFSDSAANQVMSRAFDANLSTEQNVEKIRSVLNELRDDIKSKMLEFDRAKLLTPEMRSQWLKGQSKNGAAPALSPSDAKLSQVIKKYMQEGKTADEVAAILQKKGMTFSQIQQIISAAEGEQ